MSRTFNNGDIVRVHYKSGTYIGKVVEDRGDNHLIEVLAVDKHPLQGDIHNYGQVEGVFFHERKALAHHEKMNVKKAAVHPFDKPVPDYSESLKQAVETLRTKLSEEDTEFNQKAIETLNNLEENTYLKLYNR